MDQEQYSTYDRHSEALKNLNDLLSDMKARLGSSRNEELMSAIENLESQIQSLHKSVNKRGEQLFELDQYEHLKKERYDTRDGYSEARREYNAVFEENVRLVEGYRNEISEINENIENTKVAIEPLEERKNQLKKERAQLNEELRNLNDVYDTLEGMKNNEAENETVVLNKAEFSKGTEIPNKPEFLNKDQHNVDENFDRNNPQTLGEYDYLINLIDEAIANHNSHIASDNERIADINEQMEMPARMVEIYGNRLNNINEGMRKNSKHVAEIDRQADKFERMGQSIKDNEKMIEESLPGLQESVGDLEKSVSAEVEVMNKAKAKETAEAAKAKVEERAQTKAMAKEVAEAAKVKAEERAQARAAENEVKARAKEVAEAAKVKADERAQARAAAKEAKAREEAEAQAQARAAADAEKTQLAQYGEKLTGNRMLANLSEKELRELTAYKTGLESSVAEFQKDLDRSLALAQNPLQNDLTKVKSDVKAVSSVIGDIENSFREELEKDKKILQDKQKLAKETREKHRRELEKLEKKRDDLIDDREKWEMT